MENEQKPHEYCKDCPGPEYYKQQKEHLFGKISQICEWKDKHEVDQKSYREKRELNEEKYRAKIDAKFGNLKNWAIGNMVAFIFILMGIIGVLVRQ